MALIMATDKPWLGIQFVFTPTRPNKTSQKQIGEEFYLSYMCLLPGSSFFHKTWCKDLPFYLFAAQRPIA